MVRGSRLKSLLSNKMNDFERFRGEIYSRAVLTSWKCMEYSCIHSIFSFWLKMTRIFLSPMEQLLMDVDSLFSCKWPILKNFVNLQGSPLWIFFNFFFKSVWFGLRIDYKLVLTTELSKMELLVSSLKKVKCDNFPVSWLWKYFHHFCCFYSFLSNFSSN